MNRLALDIFDDGGRQPEAGGEAFAGADRPVRNRRRILVLFPKYVPSFGTFQHAYPLMPGVQAFMPPQGPLVIAAYLPSGWDVRFIDENTRPVTDDDLAWADAVFLSGMHVQRPQINRLNRMAHDVGKLTVLGGPSVSACPEYYPDVDILHVGELGDATDQIIDRIDQSIEQPRKQLIFETAERLPFDQIPRPAYHLAKLPQYFIGSVQFSSGCPFMCEFCDIPALYGRNPRLKKPEQIIDELDGMLAGGIQTAVYFVDDNFIANPAAARELLPHLVQWQKDNGYPVHFACEATLNLAKHDDILEMMREAYFTTVFCGIETPEPEALQMMRKKQNLRSPILQAVRTFNQYGIEVVSGIILGLDSDTPDTADNILEFIGRSHIPMLTINLLYALPKTALYERLQKEDRLLNEAGRASNVDFQMPYDQVLASWRRVIGGAYDAEALFARFALQAKDCYPNRIRPRRKPTWSAIRFGVGVIWRSLRQAGMKSRHRRLFWQTAWPLLRAGRIDEAIHVAVTSHHLLTFTDDCLNADGDGDGQAEASFYADPNLESSQPTRAKAAAPSERAAV